MVNEDILKQGFEEFMYGGFDEENKNRYKLAVTAYFKAITQICDLIILRKRGFAPSNHAERFRMLEKDFHIIYKSVDGIFKIYQDTYSMPINKESCDIIRDEIKKIIRNGNIEGEFEEIVSRL